MDSQFPLSNGRSFGTLDLHLMDILSLIRPSEEDRIRRLNVIAEFTALVGSVQSLRGATVKPFGSFVSNLYTKYGDLDIAIELPYGSHNSAGKRQKQNFLRDVMRALSRRGGVNSLQFIPSARVPLLIFENDRHNISCDVSINNLVGLIKSKFLLWITEIDERFRDMVLLIKEWAKTQGINDPKNGTLNSYSLCLMVIFHFQTCTPAIFPPLMEIYGGNIVNDLIGSREDAERRIHDTCIANIRRFKSIKRVNASSLSELFFTFFSKFSNIQTMSTKFAICTYTGHWELKTERLSWMSTSQKLLIEDPFEQPENAARAVSELSRISNAISETHRKLSTTERLNRASLTGVLVRPQTGSGRRTRVPQVYSNNSRGLGQSPRFGGTLSERDIDNFRDVLRLQSRPSSSNVSYERPGASNAQVQHIWRPREGDR